jgi:hypothetical protein
MMAQQLQQMTQVANLSAQALAQNGDPRVMQAMQQSGMATMPQEPEVKHDISFDTRKR